VSVPYYRARDAAHEGSPDAAKASVTHDYQAGVQFLTELDDLLIRLPKREVCVLDHSSLGLYSLRLLVHEIPSVVLSSLDAGLPPLPGVRVWVGPCLVCKQGEEDVKLRASGVGYLDGGPGGGGRFLGAVGSQQDPTW
jgi:hypothetical protein